LTEPQTSAPGAGASDPNQRICRRAQAELGTRIPARAVCKTRAEWAAESRDAQHNMRHRHNPGSGDAFRDPPNRAVTGG